MQTVCVVCANEALLMGAEHEGARSCLCMRVHLSAVYAQMHDKCINLLRLISRAKEFCADEVIIIMRMPRLRI